MIRSTLAVCAVLSQALSAHSLDYKNWLKIGDLERKIVVTTILNTTNTYLVMRPNSALYCPPHSFNFTSDQLISMVDDAVSRKPHLADVNVETILLFEFEATFPCS
jgi:hypothetical protein